MSGEELQAIVEKTEAEQAGIEGVRHAEAEHFDALENIRQRPAFKVPLEHCECADQAANLDIAISIADRMIDEALPLLRQAFEMGAGQPRRHRAVIARFGRHPHRNAILGRNSTPEERDYVATGNFPHTTKLGIPPKDA